MRAHGLDFGSGTGETLSVLLEERSGAWSRRFSMLSILGLRRPS